MAVLSLDDFTEFQVQCPDIYGVASNCKLLKLAYHIQKNNNISVTCVDDLVSENTGDPHSMYQINHLDHDEPFFLLANKAKSGFLLKEYKSFNYLLTCPPEHYFNTEFINYITKLKDVSICFAITEIKEKEKLNFEKLI